MKTTRNALTDASTKESDLVKRLFEKNIFRAAIAICSLAAFAAVMPVLSVVGHRRGEAAFSVPCAIGAPFTTRYVHSVARTDVDDEYRALDGALWGWEESVRSHGAGLPFEAPPSGSFAVEGGRMIVRGGRYAHRSINARVGSEAFGRTVWSIAPFSEREVYRDLPGELISLSVEVAPLCLARVIWPPTIAK